MHLTNARVGRHPGQKMAHLSSRKKPGGFLLPGLKLKVESSKLKACRSFFVCQEAAGYPSVVTSPLSQYQKYARFTYLQCETILNIDDYE